MQRMIAIQTIKKQVIPAPGTIIVRCIWGREIRVIIASKPYDGNVLFLHLHLLHKPRIMHVTAQYRVADEQRLTERQQVAVTATRLHQVIARASKRLEAAHGAFTDFYDITSLDSSGQETRTRLGGYVNVSEVYCQKHERLLRMMESVVTMRNWLEARNRD